MHLTRQAVALLDRRQRLHLAGILYQLPVFGLQFSQQALILQLCLAATFRALVTKPKNR